MMEWQAYSNRYYSSQQLINQFNHDSYFFLVGGSYGDIFPNLSLIQKFIIKNKAVVHVIIDKKWEKLCQRFLTNNLNYIYINSEGQYRAALMLQNRIFSLLPGLVYPLLPTLHPHLGELACLGFISDPQVKKFLLKLDQSTKFERTYLHGKEKLTITKKFTDILLSLNCRPGKTIVLSFENNSNPQLDDLYIEYLLVLLSKYSDYDIIFNSATTFDNESKYSLLYGKYPTYQVPSDFPLEFVETAGYHIGTTHGLSMIISIYPNKIKHCLLIDISSEFINNNGLKVRAEDWLSLEKFLANDYLKSNNLTEIFIDYRHLELFDSKLNNWLLG